MSSRLLSIVVPVYNEAEGIRWFHEALMCVVQPLPYDVELVYVNDGSTDDSQARLADLPVGGRVTVQLVEFSRNFGKEAALSAGVAVAGGDAVIMLDADGQHPVEALPEFVARWESGSEVVIGVRACDRKDSLTKRTCSRAFYTAFNKTTGVELVSRSTDYRLIDRKVADQLVTLKESNRITRGLIDWLGYRRSFIDFDSRPRQFGSAGYTFGKLVQLAINCFVSLSSVPLFLAGYLGLLFMVTGFVGGTFVIAEQLVLDDPLGLNITGTAMLGILTVFLVGAILSAQGLTGVYLSRVLHESQARPLYVIRERRQLRAAGPTAAPFTAHDVLDDPHAPVCTPRSTESGEHR